MDDWEIFQVNYFEFIKNDDKSNEREDGYQCGIGTL